VTAGTGYVGIRMPNNEIALNLIKTSGLPIAAPSANKFGHVSPTKASHVFNDFHGDSEVYIIDGG
jgi:L-threonylcarbamoyladenylate synthase